MGRGPNRPDQDTDEDEYEDREPGSVDLTEGSVATEGSSPAGDSHTSEGDDSTPESSVSGSITAKVKQFAEQGNEGVSGEGQTQIGDYSDGGGGGDGEDGTSTLSSFSDGNPARALLGVAALSRTADNTTDSVESDDFTDGAQRLYEETRERVGE